MEYYYNLALMVLFSQNLLLVYTFSFGSDPKLFLRPRHAFSTGFSLTLALCILNPLSRVVFAFLSRWGLTYFSLLAYTLLATLGTYALSVLFEKLFPDIWKWTESSMVAMPTNAAVLGGILLCAQEGYTPFDSFLFGLFGGFGLLVSLLCLVGIRQNQEHHQTPTCFRGLPLLFITAGLMSLSLVGFYGLRIR